MNKAQSVIRSVLCFAFSFSSAILLTSHAKAAINKKPIVFVKPAELTELSEVLTYPARIEPRIRASITAEADGIVTKIVAPLGREVRAKSGVLVIRNTDPVYQYSPMIVSSPVTGVVSRVDVTEGSRVSRGDKLALVTDPEQVRVVVEVTAQDLRSIQAGQTAELAVPGSLSAETIALKVKGISPFVDPATGTAACELELAPQKGKKAALPPPGVIGRVTFKVNQRKGFSITDSALTYRGKDPFVLVVSQGKAKLMPVTIGRKQGGFVEIVKGLKAGDRIVERANGFVADGEEVEIQAPADDAAKSQTAG